MKPHLCYAPGAQRTSSRAAGFPRLRTSPAVSAFPATCRASFPLAYGRKSISRRGPIPTHLQIFSPLLGKNRNQRAAAILQHGRRHDPRRASLPHRWNPSKPTSSAAARNSSASRRIERGDARRNPASPTPARSISRWDRHYRVPCALCVPPRKFRSVRLLLILVFLFSRSANVQNGCLAGTNSIGASFTNVFSHRAHPSIPACSGWRMSRNHDQRLPFPSVTASAAYSTVSHSRAFLPPRAPRRYPSPAHGSRAQIPPSPGLNAIRVTFMPGLSHDSQRRASPASSPPRLRAPPTFSPAS